MTFDPDQEVVLVTDVLVFANLLEEHLPAPPQTLPFAGTILGGLRPGEMVLIQGRVPQEPDR